MELGAHDNTPRTHAGQPGKRAVCFPLCWRGCIRLCLQSLSPDCSSSTSSASDKGHCRKLYYEQKSVQLRPILDTYQMENRGFDRVTAGSLDPTPDIVYQSAVMSRAAAASQNGRAMITRTVRPGSNEVR